MSTADPRPDKNGHEPEVCAAQVRLLYEQAPSALIATLANAAILVFILWKLVPPPLLLGWLLACALVALGRFGLRRAYLRRHPPPEESRQWKRRFLSGVLANGLLWGVAGFFFFVEQSHLHQLFLAFVLAGMASGSIATLSPVRNAYPMFLGPALLPFVVRLAGAGDDVQMGMSGMMLLYIVMMGMISRRQHLAVTESLRLRFANLDLLDDLRRAKDHQALVNRELAAEITEKHLAQFSLEQANCALEQRVWARTEALVQSEQALREADRRKDEFLALLGHELRNPLAPIRNAVQIMKRTNLDAARIAWCRDVIDRQAEHLARLVNDLLDVSRISRGKIELRREPLALADIVQRAVETSRPLIDARGHELTVRLPPEPVRVEGDRVRLAQVVSNLLNNAAKYTDKGGRIMLVVEPSHEDVLIRVRDNGRGIDPAALSCLFELFYQVDRTLDRAEGGLGIGLSLVRSLVAMHGGAIWAVSEGRGRGSEFLVRLPRLADSSPGQSWLTGSGGPGQSHDAPSESHRNPSGGGAETRRVFKVFA
ncbi:sensor histidine kinase [Methylomagnum sp.]